MATPTVAEITPTVEEVAGRIKSRTRDADGFEHGTFNDQTVITEAEAEAQASRAARWVALKLGAVHTTWDGDLVASARDVVADFAALYIASSSFDEEDGSSALVISLEKTADAGLAAVIETARDNQPGGRPFHSIPMVGEAASASRSGSIFDKWGA